MRGAGVIYSDSELHGGDLNAKRSASIWREPAGATMSTHLCWCNLCLPNFDFTVEKVSFRICLSPFGDCLSKGFAKVSFSGNRILIRNAHAARAGDCYLADHFIFPLFFCAKHRRELARRGVASRRESRVSPVKLTSPEFIVHVLFSYTL